jgi:hypothetical protein
MDKYALDGTSAIPTYSFINSNTMGMYFENYLVLLIILQEKNVCKY